MRILSKSINFINCKKYEIGLLIDCDKSHLFKESTKYTFFNEIISQQNNYPHNSCICQR